MRRIIWLVLFSLFLSSGTLPKDTPPDRTSALNNYVHFMNESIHGMLIVHRLLENFNLDINKYVDLDSYQINFYSNRDLPKDIFEDPENWFYDTSPYEWYAKIQDESSVLDPALSNKLMADATYIRDLIKETNQKRFSIESLITGKDLSDTTQLQLVYNELESCVDLYDSFYKAQKRLERNLYTVTYPKPSYYENLSQLYRNVRQVLVTIRNKEDKAYRTVHSRLQSTVNQFTLASLPSQYLGNSKVKFHTRNIESQAQKALANSFRFLNDVPPSKDYELYGKHYFYYNSDLINKFNRYGSGIVFEINELLKLLNYDGLLFTELPHYYKVIYPRKLEKVLAIATETPTMSDIPLNLEGRKLTKKEEGTITIDKETIEVSIYDHMIQDGDIVSLNFNGEWVLRRHRLTSEPFNLELKLNQEGKNFLVLHAENMGQRPPNTMAVSYFAMGKKQLYVMNSDMNTSEVIELIVQ